MGHWRFLEGEKTDPLDDRVSFFSCQCVQNSLQGGRRLGPPVQVVDVVVSVLAVFPLHCAQAQSLVRQASAPLGGVVVERGSWKTNRFKPQTLF